MLSLSFQPASFCVLSLDHGVSTGSCLALPRAGDIPVGIMATRWRGTAPQATKIYSSIPVKCRREEKLDTN